MPPFHTLGHGLATNVADDPLVVLLPELGCDAFFVVLLQSLRTEPVMPRLPDGKFDPFLSLDCARVEGVRAQSKERKGSNFAIWQH